jgi:hypothetical protein
MKTLLTIIAATLFAITAQAASLTLTWQDNSDNEDGYLIERLDNPAAEWVRIAKTVTNVSTYTDEAVAFGVEYAYRVQAYNEYGYSGYSNEAQGIIVLDLEVTPPPPITPPVAPTLSITVNNDGTIAVEPATP